MSSAYLSEISTARNQQVKRPTMVCIYVQRMAVTAQQGQYVYEPHIRNGKGTEGESV